MKKQDRLNRILHIDSELDQVKDLDLLLERLLFLARREARADAGTVYINVNGKLAFSHTQNDTLQKKLKPNEKLPYNYYVIPINDESIAGFVANNEVCLNIPDMYCISKSKPYHFNPSFDEKTGYRTVSSLTFPLLSSDDELLGVMQLINARSANGKSVSFKNKDIPFFEVFARFGAKSIQRAKMTRALLETISRFAGLRDPVETNTHVHRVGMYSMELYEAWAFKNNIDPVEREKNRDMLRMVAMLHDVGKVGISDIILKKPGSLDDREYRIMQSHTWIGARQFLEDSDLNIHARDVVLHHHENWDGSGYPGRIEDLDEADKYIVEGLPQGLRGREIPLFARIVAISDVFDALSSKRVYKDAWSEDDIILELKKESNRKFDPELVELFLSIFSTIKNIRNRYSTQMNPHL